jgi:hypothetical protein
VLNQIAAIRSLFSPKSCINRDVPAGHIVNSGALVQLPQQQGSALFGTWM